ncbi:hypothetical protein V8C34DRAFT_287040 [Trichoderma compactum]
MKRQHIASLLVSPFSVTLAYLAVVEVAKGAKAPKVLLASSNAALLANIFKDHRGRRSRGIGGNPPGVGCSC